MQGIKVISVSKGAISNTDVRFPTFAEQQAIGRLLFSLDNLITLHQREYDKLVTTKQAMLQKMFPKPGEDVPEVRFDGFERPWARMPILEAFEFFSGQTYSPANVCDERGTLVLRSSNVQNDQLVYDDNVYVENGIVNCDNVRVGDIVMVVRNGSRDLIGKHAMVMQEMPNTVIGAFMAGVRSQVPGFANALLSTRLFDDEVTKNMGATINQITGWMLKNMSFMMPTIEEQQAIGSFFTNLDQLISLKSQELVKLKQVKSAMLQKMFV